MAGRRGDLSDQPCACGCGEVTKYRNAGQPQRYVDGHQHRARVYASLTERFWANVDKTGTCWNWTGRTEDGYGRIAVGSGSERAHRLSYTWANGDVPDGLIVCHHCDNRACVNPAHLYAGTYVDNARDREERNPGTQPKGEAHPRARLTEAIVRELRARVAAGETNLLKMARDLGVDWNAVDSAVRGKTWKHVDVEPVAPRRAFTVARTVPCATCGASVGEDCRRRDGSRHRAQPPHKARVTVLAEFQVGEIPDGAA